MPTASPPPEDLCARTGEEAVNRGGRRRRLVQRAATLALIAAMTSAVAAPVPANPPATK